MPADRFLANLCFERGAVQDRSAFAVIEFAVERPIDLLVIEGSTAERAITLAGNLDSNSTFARKERRR